MNTNAEVLVFAAHPDDVELSCGGSIAKLCNEEVSVAIVNLTQGEMGTRGTPKIRLQEAKNAAKVLGVKYIDNLGMQDCFLEQNNHNVEKVVQQIRRFQPKIVLMNSEFDRHPDHEVCHRIVRTAMFKSGLHKYTTEYNSEIQTPHRIRKMFSYMLSYQFVRSPDFYVDISETFETKILAIKQYESQLGKIGDKQPQTRLSSPEYLNELESRARYFGSLIGVKYAEAFLSVEPVMLHSLKSFL